LTRILLIRLRLIGDVAFTTPTLRALRRRFPDAHISYLVEPAAAPVLQGNPNLDELIVIPKRSGLARATDDIAMARRLRRARFDIAIDLHGGPRAAWLTWLSGAPMRIGYSIAGRSWMYTHVVERSPDLTPRHSVANQADLLRPLGIDGCDPVREPMEMADDAAASARVRTKLAQAGIGPDEPLVVMHVSAGNPFRRWPAQSFAAAAAALARHDDRLRVILVSGPSDHAAAAAIARDARTAAGTAGGRILEGDYDLVELRALTSMAAVYIGGDSGPLHIAATTRTPIVALLGPTLPERSRPWRDPRWFTEMVDAGPLPCRPCDQRHCAPGDFRCLTRISADQVIAATQRALQDRTGMFHLHAARSGGQGGTRA
jgi:predicted lipopolysaccharide heptosyltransferase III